MKTIMLVCSAGMSTSLLVTKMEAAAKAKGEDVKVFAVSEAESSRHFDTIDVVTIRTTSTLSKKENREST